MKTGSLAPESAFTPHNEFPDAIRLRCATGESCRPGCEVTWASLQGAMPKILDFNQQVPDFQQEWG